MSVEDLVPLKEAFRNREVYERMRINIIKGRKYCEAFLRPAKLTMWCDHLGCYDKKPTCTVDGPSLFPAQIPTLAPIITHFNNSMAMKLPFSPLHNKTVCYDDYLCDNQTISSTNHAVLGWASLILIVMGTLANLACFPAFNAKWNRTSTTFYFTGITLCNIIFLALSALMVVPHYMPASYLAQMEMYSSYSAFLVPHGLPFMQLFEITSSWFVLAVLLYIWFINRYGPQDDMDRWYTAKIMLVITTLILIYTIQPLLEFRLDTSDPKWTRVVFTDAGKNELFQSLRSHLLSIPMEHMIPQVTIAVVLTMIFFQMLDIFASYRRNLSLLPAKAGALHPRMQAAPLYFASGEFVQFCDINNNILAVSVGIFMLICKFPKLILQIMRTEEYASVEVLRSYAWMPQFLDVLFAAFCPLVYLYIGYLFLFCRRVGIRKFGSESI